ncbi:unnamed protein product [Coccothraustes coccothraustes]
MLVWLPPGSSAALARSAMRRLGKRAGAARRRGAQPADRSAHKAGAPWKLPENKGATEGRSGEPCHDLPAMSEILLCACCVHLPGLQIPGRSAEPGLPRECSGLWDSPPHL